MNRLKLFATATLMALAFTACDEGTPPPVEPPPPPTPVGTISGTVTIEGTAASGITATLSSGATTTTGSGGSFAFSGVEAGTYTVTISGFPEDATFAQVTQSATIATDGQNVQLNFAGEYIRSSAVVGNVVAADAMMSGGDGQPETLAGVTVTLGGEHAMGETMETDETGGFAFTGLRAGTYTVTISDYPEDVSFETVMVEVTVEVGDVGQADFTGHFIRTSAVEGLVSIEGEGMAGVTVTLSGGPADESFTMMTDADGMYRFEDLRPGDYTVSITDFDPRDYEFAATSQDVSVDLDETGTVSFTGVLLRTSGISGRVSVEGMGLGDIAVTLAGGGESRTAMTDAGGQYAFAGLAAGDYTVSVAVESDAYVFESMSTDVALGDDESAIVNFEGAHARTASVSGQLFLDEATKNDMMDEGEHPLAHAGIPVALVGPGVNEQQLGATDATGAFSFTGLRSGAYQLVVAIDATVAAALAANHVAYGGSATGYAIALGVGEAASQAIPFDITHTTVNFTVSLKHGDDMGAALPGASVTLYSGEDKVGSGETGDDGSVSIAVARADAGGRNMVKAGVSAEGYHVADGMTDVSWDPQMFATAAGNSNDIVNLNVNASVSGATVTTEYGGGEALAGWAIGVTMGDDAVEGAPAMLDDDGNASLMTTVSADDLPATFSFAVADDQDNELDGGENYGAQAVEYTHTGLALAGEMDAGMIEVAYTTQTLKVYVHHERDQVMGYTGNILGGDVRDDDGNITVAIRYIDDSGRSRTFAAAASVESGFSKGVHTFSNVPADAKVIVNAAVKAGATGVKLLEPDELAAYTGMETNGIMGGAFGAEGGFNHTVELCPLMATHPTGQYHGECASFAYVSTYTVSGQVWKKTVKTKGETFETTDPDFVAGTTVGLTPVEGQNLAGEDQSYTTAATDTRTDKTQGRNPTHEFGFDNIAAGNYTLSVPAGWRAKMGPRYAIDDVGTALSPLAGDLQLDVTPATGTVYGRVVDNDNFPLPGATVTANGETATTDALGRYIIDGFGPATREIDDATHSNRIFVEASKDGIGKKSAEHIAFAANEPAEIPDIQVAAATATATASVSGTVRASGTNAPIAGVEVMVDGEAPNNKAASGANEGKLVTGADGTYTAVFDAQQAGTSVVISVKKDGISFVPDVLTAPAHAGSAISGMDFIGFLHATITGRVAAPGGGPMSGAVITATSAADTTKTYADMTGVSGMFSISVPFGSYNLSATMENHTFEIPAAYRTISVNSGQNVSVGTIQARTFAASGVMAARVLTPDDESTTDTDESDPPTYNGSVRVTWSAGTVPTGHTVTYQVQTKVGDGDWTDLGDEVSSTALAAEPASDSTVRTETIPAGADGGFMVRVQSVSDNGGSPATPVTINSVEVPVAAVDPSVSSVSASRVADTVSVEWSAVTNDQSAFQVVVELTSTAGGVSGWFVAPGTIAATDREWSLTVDDAYTGTWESAVGGASTRVDAADLNNAFKVAVEWVQGTVDPDTNPWKRSDVKDVAAKPSS